MIKLENVEKKYGALTALDNLNLEVKAGEFLSIVGPSGAGKSTLIRLLIAEEKPTAGRVIVADRDITTLRHNELPFYRRKIGVIFQDFRLLPQKTVYENVAFALEVCDSSSKEISLRVPKILEMIGLTKKRNRYPKELSGGEQQRVAIARSLVHSPKILIADEPTGNLDPVNTWEIMELLYRINRTGTVVILATHNKIVVDRLKKRVVLIKNGKVISDEEKGKYLI